MLLLIYAVLLLVAVPWMLLRLGALIESRTDGRHRLPQPPAPQPTPDAWYYRPPRKLFAPLERGTTRAPQSAGASQ
jgi:hypothetical protein